MRIAYVDRRFKTKSRLLIQQANEIIADYAAQGYTLTLRQLYYQFVRRNWLENTSKNYDTLGELISDARRAGLVDWDAIVDRTRFVRPKASWEQPEDILATVAGQFRMDPWATQKAYVELWFEKDALLEIFERAAEETRLPIFSCRGYGSDSALWEAAQRHNTQRKAGHRCHILHCGDHDPSGLDMTRDIADRLGLFQASVEIHRLGLNMDQIEEHEPPPNPAKETDSRYAGYLEKYGDESWELDAMSPDVLVSWVTDAVKPLIDKSAWDAVMSREDQHRRKLAKLPDKWKKLSAKW